MRVMWERYGQPRIGITAADYWGVLNEVAGAPGALDDLREKYCEWCEDTWGDLVEAMAAQGLLLTKSLPSDSGEIRTQLRPL
jgi:hypothetical protein